VTAALPGATGAVGWPARLWVAALALAVALERFLAALWSEHHWSSDFAQHVWWTARFADPGLFPDDFIADFFSLPIFSPLGYRTWMRAAVPWLGTQTAAEVLVIPLVATLVALCWRLGRDAAGGAAAGAVVGGLVGVRLVGMLDGGLPRDFGLPLVALGMVGLLERRLWLVGASGLLAALFYPPAAVNLGLTTAVVLAPGVVRERRLPRGWIALAALGAVGVAILLHAYATPVPGAVGPKVTGAEARTLPEFGPEGRSRFFEPSFVETWFGEGRGGYGLAPEILLALAIAVGVSAGRLSGLVPPAAWALLGTAVLAHAVAHATLFLLHLPQRYVVYALPVFLVVWLSALGARGAAWAAARWPPWTSLPMRRAAAVALLAGVGGPALVEAVREVRAPVYATRVDALAFLAGLPKDTLVAAHPEDADAIPLRAKRSVLASKEVALPYYRGYYERVAERLEAELRAHYALDWETVDALWERYGADVILVHDHRYGEDQRDVDAPFASRLGAVLRAPRDDYVLVRPPDDRLLYHRGAFWVVRLGPPRPGYPPREGPNPLTSASPPAAGTTYRSVAKAPSASATGSPTAGASR